MSEDYTSIKVKDLDLMIQYYQNHLSAELIDQTDTTVLFLLGATLFEFVVGGKEALATCLTISWDDYHDFKKMVRGYGLDMTHCNGYHRASLKDVAGNLVVFSYYEMVIPSEIMIEKID